MTVIYVREYTKKWKIPRDKTDQNKALHMKHRDMTAVNNM